MARGDKVEKGKEVSESVAAVYCSVLVAWLCMPDSTCRDVSDAVSHE